MTFVWPLGADTVRFESATLELDRGDGTRLSFQVELATTPNQHRQGLMHRESLGATSGMLFIFSQDGQRSFWMKDTPIPLDMLFFDAGGRFVSMIRMAQPNTLDARRSEGPAKYVLELNGGSAERLGIGQDARIILPIGQAKP